MVVFVTPQGELHAELNGEFLRGRVHGTNQGFISPCVF